MARDRARVHPSSISYQVIEHLSVFVLCVAFDMGSTMALAFRPAGITI